jgi:pilus assembly protein CpaE
MAKKSPAKVLIADFVLQHGNVAEFLDISPQYTLLDLIENLERLDTKLLENTIHKHRSEVFVLPCPKQPEESEFFTAKETSEILKTLRSGFQYTILDIGHELNATTISCLDLSDLILLVTTPDIPSLCNTKAILQTFKKLGYTEEKVKLILNRWHMKGEIDTPLVEKNISYPIFHKLEEDVSLAINSLNQGIPISELSKNAGLVKSFDKLAKLVSETVKKGELAHGAPRTVKANGA